MKYLVHGAVIGLFFLALSPTMCSLNLGDRFAASGAVFVTGDWVDCRDLGRMVKQVRGSQECRVEGHWALAECTREGAQVTLGY